ncbi:hypothetical protein [Nocardia sp. NPDC052112]|uniref:phosphotransferase-like protein n=1 Tax=Nocardia sp. NPDC052112 TaxID=3155646 RepID=UPI00343AE8DF
MRRSADSGLTMSAGYRRAPTDHRRRSATGEVLTSRDDVPRRTAESNPPEFRAMVGVTCPLAVAEQGELARGNEIGLVRGHFRTVHDHGGGYDAEIIGCATSVVAEIRCRRYRGDRVVRRGFRSSSWY